MNYSDAGTGALAEMSAFGSAPDPRFGNKSSGFRQATYPLSMNAGNGDTNTGAAYDDRRYGNKSSGLQAATYPLAFGPDTSTGAEPGAGFNASAFLAQNKVLVAVAAAVLAGGIAYHYGYR